MLDLFRKYLNNRISRDELRQLMEYTSRPENREHVAKWINVALDEGGSREQAEQLERLLGKLDNEVLGKVKAIAEKSANKSRRISWVPYASIAAGIAVAIAVGLLFFLRQDDRRIQPMAQQSMDADIRPGGNRAVLTVEGGGIFELDSTRSGMQVRGDEVRYRDGRLIAHIGDSSAAEGEHTRYATLATPKGGQYQVTLPDGTLVWLNAASSLRYPTHFSDGIREVELMGEGYFEVVADEQNPFVVKSNGQRVQVLGTKFNVNAYLDEDVVVTTLVEGAVQVAVNGGTPRVLKPGQQSLLADGQLDIHPVDVAYYTAWVNGKFVFNREKLSVVLRQVERWYDVEFTNGVEGTEVRLWGSLSRDVTLSELLQTFEINTGLTFKREGRRITMSQ